MRYINVFCGRYNLATGTRIIAWFYIILYVFNIILNIVAVDIVKAYKENVDENVEYNREQLLTFHYICLTFGVVTVLLSLAIVVRMSESEDFMHFMVKWNVVRCIFAFAAILYACIEMNHIITVAISSVLLMTDLCASAYFTGVLASYIKELEDLSGELYPDPSAQSYSVKEPSVYLVSHKKALDRENKVGSVSQVSKEPSQSPGETKTSISEIGIMNKAGTAEDVEKDVEGPKETARNSGSTSTGAETQPGGNMVAQLPLQEIHREVKPVSEPDEKSTPNLQQEAKTDQEESITSPDTKIDSNVTETDIANEARDATNEDDSASDVNVISETRNDALETEREKQETQETFQESTLDGSEISEKCEDKGMEDPAVLSKTSSENPADFSQKSDEDHGIKNASDLSEKSSEVKGIENPAVDEIEPPTVVIIPASPDQDVINVDENRNTVEGMDNPAVEMVGEGEVSK